MLVLKINGEEYYDEAAGEFIYGDSTVIRLEHSLVSVSKWESKWHKSFFSDDVKTPEEANDYFRCMILDDNFDENVMTKLTIADFKQIKEYIDDPHTATTINDRAGRGGGRQKITSEVIYSQMIALEIPFECQYWHLNRLLTLIRVCAAKNSPTKKMSKQEIYEQNKLENSRRRAKMGSKG